MTPRHTSLALTIAGIGALSSWWLFATPEYVMWIGMWLLMAATVIDNTWPQNRTKNSSARGRKHRSITTITRD